MRSSSTLLTFAKLRIPTRFSYSSRQFPGKRESITEKWFSHLRDPFSSLWRVKTGDRYIDLPQANFGSPGHKGSSLPGYRAK